MTLPNTKVRAHGLARKPNVRYRSMLCTKCSIHPKLPDPSVSYLQKTRKRQRYATDGHIHNCRRRVSHACMQKFKTPCTHLPSKHSMQEGPNSPDTPRNAIIIKPNQGYLSSIITLRARPVLLRAGARRSATAAVLPRSARSSLRARLPASAVLSGIAWTSVVVARAPVSGDTAAHAFSPCTRSK